MTKTMFRKIVFGGLPSLLYLRDISAFSSSGKFCVPRFMCVVLGQQFEEVEFEEWPCSQGSDNRRPRH